MKKKYLFLDCESAGLRGDIFAAALVGYDGKTIFNGFYRHPELQTNNWLKENVEPNLNGIEYKSAVEFQKAFVEAYESTREEYGFGPYKSLAVVTHMGVPVEANFFQQLFHASLLEEFSGPYPLLDTSTLLEAQGEPADSEHAYAKAYNIELKDYIMHSALSDAHLTRLVWKHLTEK